MIQTLEDMSYIKLFRKITEWQWYTDGNTFRLFMHLLIKANNREGWIRGIRIGRGQRLTGLNQLNLETGLSIQEIRTALRKLKSTGEINIESNERFSIITLCKYEDYQGYNPSSTNKSTNEQQATNTQLTTNNINNKNNNNNISDIMSADGHKNEDPEIIPKWEAEFEECWKLYPDKSGKLKAKAAYKKAYKEGTRIEDVLRGLNRYACYIKTKRAGGFRELQVQNGSTWFNQRGWENEYTIEDKGVNNGMPKFD